MECLMCLLVAHLNEICDCNRRVGGMYWATGVNRKAGLWFVFHQLLRGMILGCLGNSA